MGGICKVNKEDLKYAIQKIDYWYKKHIKFLTIITVPFNTACIFSDIIDKASKNGERVLYVWGKERENRELVNSIREFNSQITYSYFKESDSNSQLTFVNYNSLRNLNNQYDLVIFDDITYFSNISNEKLFEYVREYENMGKRIIVYNIERLPIIGEKIELSAYNYEQPFVEPRVMTTRIDLNIDIPYSLYDLTVERDGFDTVIIRGCQVFPTQIAYQVVNLENNLGRGGMRQEVINIPPNTLNGDYPPKIPEDPEKPLPPPTSGVVLPQPIVPEYIIVHQGVPDDPSAPNYKVPFKDYIKNVASCEIYSTWTNSAIRANIFCIISFTLNRIYTEWYRGKGKNFDITSSTAYDHAFAYGRNFYDNISQIVDEIFSTYVRRIGRKQPLLTQYCDGKRVSCPEWLSQWGSQKLGVQGKVPYEILRYYYGNNIELVTAEKVAGSPQSYPGRPLTIGSSGSAVRTIQSQLNRIARNYPLIPRVAEDGIYGPKTAEAVKTFQQIFGLPQTGVVDYATWYKISDVYVGVTRIAELTTTESSRIVRQNMFIPPIIPGLDNKRGIPKFYY